MSDIPIAPARREVTGGAQADQQTQDAQTHQTTFQVTLQASLLDAFSISAQPSPRAEEPSSLAQKLRSARERTPDPREVVGGLSAQAGVLRPATASELAAAELMGQLPEQPTPNVAEQQLKQQRQGDRAPTRRPGRPQAVPPEYVPARAKSTEPAQPPAGQQAASRQNQPASPSASAPAEAQSARQAAPARQAELAAQVKGQPAIRAVAQAQIRSGLQPARTGVATPTRPSQPLSAARARPAAQSPSVLKHARAFQSQLAKGLAAALKRADATITLRLRPHTLGKLTIELNVRDAGVVARVQATSEAARSLLESGSAELRESLASRGLSLHRLDVHVVNAPTPDQADHAQRQPTDSNDQHRHGAEAQREPASHTTRAPDAGMDGSPPAAESIVTLGLDVVV